MVVVWYLEMFRKLERSRSENGYIPLSEILICSNNYELIGTKEEFVNIMLELDGTYVRHYDSRHKKDG